ncbi:HNH endonuclease [Pseudomonas sp. GTC 16482]|uniref:HNH endonuclease n=1 Tax=Pseudomonas sp. GTC 16482 TaxID=1661693 RepID=UPI000761FCA9|nr:HNH endonuclease [Pseudomonas sp. GTC 16482]
MPLRPQRPCRAQGCRSLHRNANGYCDSHAKVAAEQAKAWATRKGSGRGGRPWRRLRDRILKRDQYLCRCDDCTRLGRIREADEVDHIVALAHGGTDDDHNLRAINRDCHKAKTQRESKAIKK